MADGYLLESSTTDRLLLEDGTGVYALDPWSATVTDPLDLTDVGAILHASVQSGDTLGLTDAVIVDHQAGGTTHTPVVNDTLGLSDTVTVNLVRVVTDPLGLTDTLTAARVVTVTDTLGLTDAQTVGYSPAAADLLGLSDALTVALVRVVTDNLGLTDTATPSGTTSHSATVNDNLGLTDDLIHPGPRARLNRFELQLPTGVDGNVDEVSRDDLLAGYTSTHFRGLADGTGYRFTVRADGASIVTGAGGFPRTELREVRPDGSNAAWDYDDGLTRRLFGTFRINHLPDFGNGQPNDDVEVVLFQLHNETGEAISLRTSRIGAGTIRVAFRKNGTTLTTNTITQDYVYGTDFEAGYEVGPVTTNLLGAGGTVLHTFPSTDLTDGPNGLFYVKLGAYAQFNENSTLAAEYVEVEWRDFALTTPAAVVADPLGLTDATTEAQTVIVTDTLGLSDSPIVYGHYLIGTDPLGLTDTTSPNLTSGGTSHSRTVDDLLGLTDLDQAQTVEVTETLTDPLGLTDAVTAALVRRVDDPLGLTDTTTTTRTVTVTDPLGLTDATTAARTVVVTDPLGLTDSVDVTASGALSRTVNDALNLTDDVTATRATFLTNTDNLGLTDTVAVSLVRRVDDTLGLTDDRAVARTVVVTDTLGLTDTAAPTSSGSQSATVNDNLGLTDSLTVLVARGATVNDTLGLTDTVLVTRRATIDDLLALTDQVTVDFDPLVPPYVNRPPSGFVDRPPAGTVNRPGGSGTVNRPGTLTVDRPFAGTVAR